MIADELLQMLYYAIFALLALLLFAYYKLTYWKRRGVPNDYKSIYRRFLKPFHASDYDGFLEYGKVVGIYEAFQPVLVIADPVLAQEVMVSQFCNFGNHRFVGDKIDSIGSKMLFTLGYEDWKRVRKIISPSFSAIKLKSMIGKMCDAINTLVNHIETAALSNDIVDAKKFLCCLTLDIITSCAFGIKVESLKDPNNSIIENSNKLFSTDISLTSLIAFMCPSLAPLGTAFGFTIFDLEALKYFQNFITETVKKRRSLNSESMTKAKDLIQLLMDGEIPENGIANGKRKLTEEEIVDQGIIFILAGHESTATSLAAGVYCLAKNQDCQQKLYDEISMLTEKETEDYDTIKQLKYLDAVVLETLRMYPPVPRIERRATNDTELGKIKIQKGTLITIPAYTMHRDKDYFERPNEFLPDRFLNVFECDINKAYVAFASGPRNCVGERFAMLVLKLSLIKIFRKFSIHLCPETKEPVGHYLVSLVASPKSVPLRPLLRNGN